MRCRLYALVCTERCEDSRGVKTVCMPSSAPKGSPVPRVHTYIRACPHTYACMTSTDIHTCTSTYIRVSSFELIVHVQPDATYIHAHTYIHACTHASSPTPRRLRPEGEAATHQVKSSQVKSSRVKSGRVKSSRVKSSRVESSRVKSSQVKSSRAKSNHVNSCQVESSQVKSNQAQSSPVRSPSRSDSAAGEHALHGDRHDAGTSSVPVIGPMSAQGQ